MVCNRCILGVLQEFKIGTEPVAVNMGKVELSRALKEAELKNMVSDLLIFVLRY